MNKDRRKEARALIRDAERTMRVMAPEMRSRTQGERLDPRVDDSPRVWPSLTQDARRPMVHMAQARLGRLVFLVDRDTRRGDFLGGVEALHRDIIEDMREFVGSLQRSKRSGRWFSLERAAEKVGRFVVRHASRGTLSPLMAEADVKALALRVMRRAESSGLKLQGVLVMVADVVAEIGTHLGDDGVEFVRMFGQRYVENETGETA